MRIQYVKLHLEKVLEYTRTFTRNRSVYKKTRDHLSEIVDLCQAIIDEIQKIVNSSSLHECEDECERQKDNVLRYTPSQCAVIVQKFTTALRRNSKIEYDFEAANQCSEVLWRWFNSRYLVHHNKATPFRYNVMDFKVYIHAIVIAFGYYYENEDIDLFYAQFDKWESDLVNSDKSNRYVVPYEIAKIGKQIYEEHATLTSAIIWHLFTANGLLSIRRDNEKDGAYINHNDLIYRLFSVNPYIEDEFEEYIVSIGGDTH